MAEGIEVRHSRSCASRDGKRCNCSPGYRVAAYDPISKRKVSKTFKALAEARRWRAGAQTQAAKGVRLAGTSQTRFKAAETFVDGIATAAHPYEERRAVQAVGRARVRALASSPHPPHARRRTALTDPAARPSAPRRRVARLRRRSEHDPQRAQAAPGDLPARDRGWRPRCQPVRAAPASRRTWPPRAHRLADRGCRAGLRPPLRGPWALGLRVLRRPAAASCERSSGTTSTSPTA
jgi:hypothetical protein